MAYATVQRTGLQGLCKEEQLMNHPKVAPSKHTTTHHMIIHPTVPMLTDFDEHHFGSPSRSNVLSSLSFVCHVSPRQELETELSKMDMQNNVKILR
jgi:hypothetical protein